jgi:predicted acylesterase/phospholipase RssA
MDTSSKITPSDINEYAICDLIMKGGITSGVIYPKLISKLAEKYKLKNIGGTSAGAIAAAGAAAAEFRRHTQNTNAGFDELKKLPDFLGDDINSHYPD